MDYKKLAGYFDHTLLKPTATENDIDELCLEADNYGFASVCVNLSLVEYTCKKLHSLKSRVKVCSVIDFPFGASTSDGKLFQIKEAFRLGALEADVVINIGKLLAGDLTYCIEELKPLIKFANNEGMLIKVIVETCYLDEKRIKDACNIVEESGADFIKTSTGYGSRGASFEDIILFKKYLQRDTKIKASGGIRSLDDALKYLALGCERIGASRTVSIINEAYAKDIIARD